MDVSLSFAGHAFRLLPCGALFWPARSLLLVADLHLEKGSHYAARGWLLPPHDSLETLGRLEQAMADTGATAVAALGDSFHDPDGFDRLERSARRLLEGLAARASFLWVDGNHEGRVAGLPGRSVAQADVDGIMIRHDARPGEPRPEISGHYHPKVTLALRTGRRVTRRCLASAPGKLVLPAYGAYAGGLSVDDPALHRALGAAPDAYVAVGGGLVRVPPAARREPRTVAGRWP